MTNSVMIVAGEASGDMYGAHLVQAMKKQNPDLHFIGMGGSKMREAGVDLKVDAAHVSVVGLFEVFKQLTAIFSAAKQLKHILKTKRPDLLILIDFPDFNFHIAKYAKKLTIPIFYYISPQVWAWRKSRIHTIKKCVNLMMVILPFEVDFYKKAHIPVHYEGHPLIDFVKTEKIRKNENHPIIGLLPGSRHGEIERHMPVLIESAHQLKKLFPHAKFIIPVAPTLSKESFKSHLPDGLSISLATEHLYETLSRCNVVITASGTVTLEVTLLQIPMVIIYKVNPLSFFIAKHIIDVPYIGLCNLIANQKIVPELIQDEAIAKNIVNEVKKILENEPYRNDMKKKLFEVKSMLGQEGVTQRVAQTALQLLAV